MSQGCDDKKTILITGCSTGIGYETAMTLLNRGHHVIASCRKEKDRDKLREQGIPCVLLDVDKDESINQALADVFHLTKNRLDVLINNAGYGQSGALEDLERTQLEAQFQTNVFGLMALTRRVIPVMRNQGGGRIINLSSVLGIISLPFRGAYNASKYAVEGLSDTLRLELKPANIDVITIEPGPIVSEFRNTSIQSAQTAIDMEQSIFKSNYQTMLASFETRKNEAMFTRTPDAVVKKIIHAIEAKKPKAKYPVTVPTHVFSWLKRLLPTKWLDSILRQVSKHELGDTKKKSQR